MSDYQIVRDVVGNIVDEYVSLEERDRLCADEELIHLCKAHRALNNAAHSSDERDVWQKLEDVEEIIEYRLNRLDWRDEDVVDRGDGIETDGGRGAPLTYDEPTRRRDRAESHFCDVVGSRVFCTKIECPYDCHDDEQIATDGGKSEIDVDRWKCPDCGLIYVDPPTVILRCRCGSDRIQMRSFPFDADWKPPEWPEDSEFSPDPRENETAIKYMRSSEPMLEETTVRAEEGST